MKKWILLLSVLFILFNGILKGQNNAPPLPQRTVNLILEMPLNFGDIAAIDGQAGTATMGSDGIRTANNVALLNIYESPHRAELSFHLCPGRSVVINWSPSTFNMLSDGEGTPVSVTINDVKVNNVSKTNGQSFSSNKGCSDTHYIYIGGVLTLAPSANYVGTYTGSFDVTITYQ